MAAAGCAAIVRVDQSTLEQSVLRWDTPLEVTTGKTYLHQDGSDLYCGAWHRIFRISNWTAYEELVPAAKRVSGITLARSHLYWLDHTSQSQSGSEGEVWMLDETASPIRVASTIVSGPNFLDYLLDSFFDPGLALPSRDS